MLYSAKLPAAFPGYQNPVADTPDTGGAICIALIADIVKSRQHGKRSVLQDHLKAVTLELNHKFGPALLAPVTMSRGDELQALLKRAEPIPDILWSISQRLGGTEIRFAFGLGALDTGLRALPTETDGPAWWHARAAIEHAAKTKRKGGVFRGFGQDDPVLTALASLLDHIRHRMTAKQRAVAGMLRNGDGAADIAAKLGITRQAVYHHSRGAGWEPYSEGEAAWKALLRKYDWSAEWERG